MPRIAYHTLGCKLNFAETSTYRRGLEAVGCTTVPWGAEADVYILNSCAVTTVAEKKSRGLVRNVHRRCPAAKIVVTGCYAALRPDEIRAIDGVALVLTDSEKTELVSRTLSLLAVDKDCTDKPCNDGAPLLEAGVSVGFEERAVRTGPRAGGETADIRFVSENPTDRRPEAAVLPAYSAGDRTRSFLKVQDGCDNFCAYCTVPFARGRSRNLPLCEIVKQAKAIAAQGVKEIVLTGVNTGDFGRSTGESFLDLLKALNEVEGIARYRISSIEPNLLTEEIIDWIASGTKFLPHFHIPLQSGSDWVLKNVGRRYDTALFASRIDRIREKMGDKVFFGIDVIAGLPGETEERFEEGYRFLAERIRPAYLHIFPYSPRPGTRAAKMPDQVRDGIKTERVARLEALCEDLHAEFVASCKGMHETVLWEAAEKDGKMEGYTGNYIRLERPYDPALAGQLEDIVL
ncbi:MAG: tRNA (N(6)-L-threonylcarbamoyladenosine(37)-C(2))-methylthiotransferase MtaB [Bacteroidota bacterium]|nr:tRNA (N(6)-L-threonylcarbamoyladenosine(37)-C(2))-methylthiotransferase MtaB [Bacteroidota bacterium]